MGLTFIFNGIMIASTLFIRKKNNIKLSKTTNVKINYKKKHSFYLQIKQLLNTFGVLQLVTNS